MPDEPDPPPRHDDPRFSGDPELFRKAEKAWKKRDKKRREAPAYPKPRGPEPRDDNGVKCIWDDTTGGWRTKDGAVHEVNRDAKREAFFTEKNATKKEDDAEARRKQSAQRRADSEEIDAEAQRLLVEAPGAPSGSHCMMPLVADVKTTANGRLYYEPSRIFYEAPMPRLYWSNGSSMDYGSEGWSFQHGLDIPYPNLGCGSNGRFDTKVVMSKDCKQRTRQALEALGCYGAITPPPWSLEDPRLCVRRSNTYWEHVDKLLAAHGDLSRDQYEYHLRSSLEAKIKDVISAMRAELRTEAEARALAEFQHKCATGCSLPLVWVRW